MHSTIAIDVAAPPGLVFTLARDVERWERLWEAVEDQAAIVPIVAGGLPDGEPEQAWIAIEAARILGWAQAKALEILGDREAGTAIMGRWFRSSAA